MLTTDPSALLTKATTIGQSLEGATRQAMADALAYTAMRLGKGPSPLERLSTGDVAAHSDFRYALAAWVGRYLGQVDDTIVSVHVLDEQGDGERMSVTEPLTLILVVERKTAALESLLRDLDKALADRYRESLAPHADGMTSLLAAVLADAQEVASRTGAGGLLHAVHQPPTRAWAR